MTFVHRRRPDIQRPTLIGALSAAVNAANARMRGFGRTEWDAREEKLARDILCNRLRSMPPPYPQLADRIEAASKTP